MARTILPLLAVLVLGAATAPAHAQMPIGPGVGAITGPIMLNPCPGGRCVATPRPGDGGAPASRTAATTPDGLSAGLYQPTAALQQQAVAGFVNRLRQKDPAQAAQLETALRQNSYAAEYNKIVASDGFRTDSLSDAMAAYALLGWLIVHNVPDSQPGQATGLRRQFAARVAANPQILPQRAQIAEELKILVYIVASGWVTAEPAAKPDYAAGVGNIMQQQFGLDMRVLDLTGAGFTSR